MYRLMPAGGPDSLRPEPQVAAMDLPEVLLAFLLEGRPVRVTRSDLQDPMSPSAAFPRFRADRQVTIHKTQLEVTNGRRLSPFTCLRQVGVPGWQLGGLFYPKPDFELDELSELDDLGSLAILKSPYHHRLPR